MMAVLTEFHAQNSNLIEVGIPPDVGEKRKVSKLSIPVGVSNCLEALRENDALIGISHRKLAGSQTANGKTYSHVIWGKAIKIRKEELA